MQPLSTKGARRVGRIPKTAIFIFLAILCSPGITLGQSTYASLTGTVTDSTGAVVPNATVTATNLATNIKSESISNEVGAYMIGLLKEGTYSLKVEGAGFKEAVVNGISLTARDIRRVDVSLSVGAVESQVTVTSGATLIETETARISATQDAKALNLMPLNARWLWAYLDQVPNLLNGDDGYRFAGSTGNQNNWSIDGSTMNDGQGWAIGPQLNYIESFQEVKVDTTNNSAEFGAIGQVDVITKSGTNQLHGSAYDTFMTPGLRARNFFANSIWTGRFHIFGGGIGGPVVIPGLFNGKNKTFFYSSFERSAGNASFTNLNPSVPIQAWRNGDFSSLLPDTVIYDPQSGSPFAGNVIPTNRLNSVAKLIQDKYYPLPNVGSGNVFQPNNYKEVKTMPWNVPWSWTGRIDHHFSEKDFVYGRAIVTNSTSRWWESNLPTVGLHIQHRPTRSATASYSHLFSASLSNEVRFGMNYNNIPAEGPVRGSDEVKRLGLVGLASNLPDVAGMLQVGFDGFGLQSIGQWNGADPQFLNDHKQIQDRISWFHGRHSVKAGFDIVRVRGDDFTIPDDLFGSAMFSNRFTSLDKEGAVGGFPYADFLLGIPTTVSRSTSYLDRNRNRWQYGMFVTDEIKVRKDLTLNFGLRYQIHQPWREQNGRMSIFDVTSGKIVVPDGGVGQVSPLFPTSFVKVASASSLGLPSNTLLYTDRNDFAPRVGLAWRPFGEHTVVRAGYGVFYDVTPFDFSNDGSPFVLAEPSYTNPTSNPQVILPRVFPARNDSGEAYTDVSLPNAVNPKLVTPWSHQYSLTIEHQRWNTGFRASYIGTAMRQGTYSYDYNSPVPDGRPYISKPRPFPNFPSIMYRTNGAGHQYNSLSTEVKRSFASGLYYQFAWTWARDRYDLGRWDTLENPFNRQREVGVAADVPTHRVTANWAYELPFGRGKKFGGGAPRAADVLIGGWTLSGTYASHSGQFLTPLWSGPDPTGIAYTDSDSPAYVTIRPDQIRDGNLPKSQRTINRWFDASAFKAPQAGRFGTSAKGVIKGPNSFVWNAGLQKKVSIGERVQVIMEITSRNVFNRANFSNPDMDISDAGSVGVISWAGGISDNGGPREERLGLRIVF
ncbi:MAG: TonB-dependent receptor [Bryobacterales bacterium]|nr:TonB-dependent receptor [Bryobacterales bacterium]